VDIVKNFGGNFVWEKRERGKKKKREGARAEGSANFPQTWADRFSRGVASNSH